MNKGACRILRRVYNNLERSVNATSDLQLLFLYQKDKRSEKVNKAVRLIMEVQALLNSLADDDDIRIV
jgi:hypothetical protein